MDGGISLASTIPFKGVKRSCSLNEQNSADMDADMAGGQLGGNRIVFYLARMRARGFSSQEVLSGTGLTEEQIQGFFLGSSAVYRQIISNMIRLTGNEFIGVELGAEFKISDFGVLGYASLSSSTLRQSRRVLAQYCLLNQHIIRPVSTITEKLWLVEILEIHPLDNLIAFAVEEYVSRAMELAFHLTNRYFPVLEMRVTYDAPSDLSVYQERFNCPIYFNQKKNVIRFDPDHIDDPISLANPEVFRICEQQCQLISSKISKRDSLERKVRDMLISRPGNFPPVDDMADLLAIKPRTLRRQLQAEGISYQQILDETRRDLALQYLEYTALTPKEIGFLLGYNDVSNFRRAFRSWTGSKLSDYR
ncbi:putative Ornithine utilization regulator [Denitratisoma oestradiolicum]|uniref:Putative Ornithine utilization regulator n=2 Tax=Denitratisoma oestradiolicum TaxID=311182 RepID=A0A6S6Y0X1_9PROT|nr:putative Ornithine utilization regulator [Denitratisoma oestradiolicum]